MLFVCIFFVLCSNEIFSSNVPIQTFTPQPIRLTINDLPSPFHTESAAKPSIIVPPIVNGSLFVPDKNFRVTIFRKGLQSPRQMIYTPNGDILVTDGRGSRIVILYDNETSVFADQSNGIAQAFGMAFVQVSLMNPYSNFLSSCFRIGSMWLMPVIYDVIVIRMVIASLKVPVKFFSHTNVMVIGREI